MPLLGAHQCLDICHQHVQAVADSAAGAAGADVSYYDLVLEGLQGCLLAYLSRTEWRSVVHS